MALGAAWFGGPAAALDLETLVMPGPVIEGHADIEAECSHCHAPFSAAEQDGLCLECHEEVGADLETGTGFHGRSPGVDGTPCSECHGEHRGRDADVVGLDSAGFDHRLTDYPLRGAHARVACGACHESGSPHREAPSDCIGCHRADDPHAGELGETCDDCHVETGWSEARFDHAGTDFPLEGRHADVECSLCHAGDRYAGTPSDCQGCHRVDDAHMGRFGTGCGECHSPAAWDSVHFDHDRDTRFVLSGRHRKTACEGCHVGGLDASRKPESDCVACHRADDVHRGRNGDDCERCHSATAWSSEKFDHDRMTDFALKGAHARVKCERCHTGPLAEQEFSTNCYACHRDDDVHGGQEGTRCESCHSEQAWQTRVFFDHDLTSFPLLGLHAVTACEQCHASARYRDAPRACVGCHDDDDAHLKRLGPTCGDCHNPNGWKLWLFEHDTQTSFALHGAHREAGCHDCHRAPVEDEISLPSDCRSCHVDDDVHHGAFGRDCGRCHGEDAWRPVRMGY